MPRQRNAFLFLLLLCFPLASHAWWQDEWSFRKQITLNTTAQGANLPGTLTEFPVLVRLHAGNFPFFQDINPTGADLRFVAMDDQTPLKYHIEHIDPLNGLAYIWVKLPRVAGGSMGESIWMYYGNAAATDGQEPVATLDSRQVLVYHFDGEAVKDATSFANHPDSASASLVQVSFIGGGLQTNGSTSVKLENRPALRADPKNGLTLSLWAKSAQAQNGANLLQWRDGNTSLALEAKGSELRARFAAGKIYETSPATLPEGAWHHVAVTLTADKLSLYVDGAEAASVAVKFDQEFGGALSLGAATDGTLGFVGEIDEVQVSNIARDANWVRALFVSQTPDSMLLTYGEDEQGESGGTSYFGIILKNVTIDGWVVIVVLVVMAVISWLVMFGKGLYINRVRRDNAQFLSQFKKLSEDPGALDAEEDQESKELESASPLAQALFGKHDHFQSSSIYRIYHTGIQDIHRRVGQAVGADAAALSPQAIATIRAGLDATLVRETQRLNSQMVLLTIAISGGPFLGLLGTVVGVMITFAAIAAAGDVNVNAIAPGIAAALVATVAGLAVAIPALFGYNYLASRIKEIVADMHVFVDEFISRIAEHYGR